jgi:sec-independent protein translocase protein TatA
MLSNLTGWHFLIILVVILLLFGAPKLPGLARSLGQSMKIFKSEITPERTDDGTSDSSADSTRADSTRADSTRADSARADGARADGARADPSSTPNPKA